MHHHVHDLRRNKGSYPVKGGGWLSIDFEDAILNVLGLGASGKASAPTLGACGKNYAVAIVFRHLQTLLLK